MGRLTGRGERELDGANSFLTPSTCVLAQWCLEQAEKTIRIKAHIHLAIEVLAENALQEERTEAGAIGWFHGRPARLPPGETQTGFACINSLPRHVDAT